MDPLLLGALVAFATIGVLFSGDCRGDACEIIGSAGFH